MSTHNIGFNGEITKIIPKLSSNTLLICSTVTSKFPNANSSDNEEALQTSLTGYRIITLCHA